MSEETQRKIDALVAHLRRAGHEGKEGKSSTNGGTAAPPYIGSAASAATDLVSDEDIIKKCRAAENAAKFSDLYDHGDVHAHHGGDDSVADLALLGILAFWTQNEAQLERLVSSSALGRRTKWRSRPDYRRRTITRALADLGEIYDWTRNGSGTAARPIKRRATKTAAAADEEGAALRLVRFAGRPSPGAREFLIPDLIPRYHPTTFYGWGGTAKSLIALLLAMSVAGGKKRFFGRDVAAHGPVLYLDFELDANEQHRRVLQLAAGMEAAVPNELLYVSTLGVRTHEAIEFALTVCEEHEVVLVVLDSLGPAMVGDMAAAKDVIEFHNCYITPFKEAGATPLLVDHQARQQAGEGYQSKGAFGSAYKEHLSRSLIQVERGDHSFEQGTLNVRLRHKKTNFGALCDPFDVALTFSDEKITASVRELASADRAQEATLNSKDRVVAALEDGPAYPDDLVEATGLARGTVKNAITTLKKAEQVETTGEVRGQMERVRLVAPAARPIKGSASSAAEAPNVVRAVEAFRHGNGPRKNLETFYGPEGCKIEYLAKSVLVWLGRPTDKWPEWAKTVTDAAETVWAEITDEEA